MFITAEIVCVGWEGGLALTLTPTDMGSNVNLALACLSTFVILPFEKEKVEGSQKLGMLRLETAQHQLS